MPFVAANWPLAHILRDDEKKRLTGGTWYAWGCTLTMGAPPPARPATGHRNKPTSATTKPLPNQATTKPTNPAARAAISPPSIAITSILFLVLGDMSAAIIGVSFGREVSTVRIGRGGRKSMEGAVAMFAVCFVIGSTMFASVNLREYPVFFGALAATTEVYEPLGLNDNLTIPFFAGLASVGLRPDPVARASRRSTGSSTATWTQLSGYRWREDAPRRQNILLRNRCATGATCAR